MFGYQINDHLKLKILEEREAEPLFKLVDNNRNYLAEFLPFVDTQRKLKIVKHLFSRPYNNLRVEMDFIVAFGMIKTCRSYWIALFRLS